MNIMDCLCAEAVTVDLKATDKNAAITELVEMLKTAGRIKKTAEIVELLMQREQLGSTGVGQGLALPHARTDTADSLVAAFGVSRAGVEFGSPDGKPAHLIFLLVSPLRSDGGHLLALARVSRLFKDAQFNRSLREAKTVEELLERIRRSDGSPRPSSAGQETGAGARE